MGTRYGLIARLAVPVAAGLLVACGSLPTRTEIREEQVARLEIVGGGRTQITVDGKVIGNVPEGQRRHRLEVPAGLHRVSISRDGIALYDQQVLLTKGTVKSVKVGK